VINYIKDDEKFFGDLLHSVYMKLITLCFFPIFSIFPLLCNANAPLACDFGNSNINQQCDQIEAISLKLQEKSSPTSTPQVCVFRTSIVSNDGKMKMEQQCLAVLVDPHCTEQKSSSKYFLTSAHCTQKEMVKAEAKYDESLKWLPGESTLDCRISGKSVTSKVAKANGHEKFGQEIKYLVNKLIAHEKNQKFDEPNPGLNDIAIGETEGNFDEKPLCIDSRTPLEIKRDYLQCEIHKKGKVSLIPSVTNIVFEPEIGVDVLYSNDANRIADGDSGGALICIQNNKKVVSGINSSDTLSKTRIQLVYPARDWILKSINN